MKRKIIKSGRGFLSSLPIDWIREHKLDSGHEIELEKVGHSLIISPNKPKITERIRLNAHDTDSLIERLIPAIYRVGYNEIEINYEGSETLKHIQDVLDRELIGFEIIAQGKSSCIIKDISGRDHEAFETLLKRSYLLLLSNAKDCSIALKKKDIKKLKEICHRDKNINKLTNFCERLLIKDTSFTTKKTAFLFHFIKELENLADEYKYLSEHHLKTRNFNNKKGIELLDEINTALDKGYHLFYNFRKQDASELETDMKGLNDRLLN